LGASKINPHIPVATLEQVAQQIAKPDSLTLIKSNKAFHQFLLEGMKVEFKAQDAIAVAGEADTKIDYVKLIDFANVANNEFLVVNQYTLLGKKVIAALMYWCLLMVCLWQCWS
jgi:type I restriction enzyme R subunit